MHEATPQGRRLEKWKMEHPIEKYEHMPDGWMADDITELTWKLKHLRNLIKRMEDGDEIEDIENELEALIEQYREKADQARETAERGGPTEDRQSSVKIWEKLMKKRGFLQEVNAQVGKGSEYKQIETAIVHFIDSISKGEQKKDLSTTH